MTKLLVTIAFLGIWGCEEPTLPDDGTKAEFKIENFPCSISMQQIAPLSEEGEPLYGVQVSCSEGFDFRRMQRYGDILELSEDEVEELVTSDDGLLAMTPKQFQQILTQLILDGVGR